MSVSPEARSNQLRFWIRIGDSLIEKSCLRTLRKKAVHFIYHRLCGYTIWCYSWISIPRHCCISIFIAFARWFPGPPWFTVEPNLPPMTPSYNRLPPLYTSESRFEVQFRPFQNVNLAASVLPDNYHRGNQIENSNSPHAPAMTHGSHRSASAGLAARPHVSF